MRLSLIPQAREMFEDAKKRFGKPELKRALELSDSGFCMVDKDVQGLKDWKLKKLCEMMENREVWEWYDTNVVKRRRSSGKAASKVKTDTAAAADNGLMCFEEILKKLPAGTMSRCIAIAAGLACENARSAENGAITSLLPAYREKAAARLKRKKYDDYMLEAELTDRFSYEWVMQHFKQIFVGDNYEIRPFTQDERNLMMQYIMAKDYFDKHHNDVLADYRAANSQVEAPDDLFLLELQDLRRTADSSGSFPQSDIAWQGAEVAICQDAASREKISKLYDDFVVSPYYLELSWLFLTVRNIFYNSRRILGMDKYRLFGKMVEAINKVLKKNPDAELADLYAAALDFAVEYYKECTKPGE